MKSHTDKVYGLYQSFLLQACNEPMHCKSASDSYGDNLKLFKSRLKSFAQQCLVNKLKQKLTLIYVLQYVSNVTNRP